MTRFFLALLPAVFATALAFGQISPIPVGPLPFSSVCTTQTPAVTNIGANGTSSGSTVTITGVTVPSGSLIVVVVAEIASTTIGGTVSDGVNTYSSAGGIFINNSSANGFINTFYAPNASLSSGTITYTKQTSPHVAGISAIYSSNIVLSSALDSAVTATAGGSSSTPSVTSGTPVKSGELFVGAVGNSTDGGTIVVTQDSGHGWAFPPNTDGVVTVIAGGNQVNSGVGTKVFAPTLNQSTPWAASVVGFFPKCS
jgi:hypothetical protein